jgi:isoleucyl-tRNA synthetase
MFPHLPDQLSFTALEREILAFWRESDVFARSVESRPADRTWTFFEGPPTVNGIPGIHHILSRGLKDMFCRYKTMQGFRVRRKAGWDTHGLPVEIALEKQLGIKDKAEIETRVGVANFNRMAKEFVYEHINKPGGWRELTERMGYWVNLDDPYITCTNEYIESVWWALSQFFQKGLIYRGFKIVPQCPHCETPLSSHELALGYDEVRDPSLYVKVRVAGGQSTGEGVAIPQNAFFLVWTTTPWTLISNVALAVGAEIDYLMTTDPESGETYIFAEARRDSLDPDHKWAIDARIKGKDLERLRYERLFSYVPVDRDAFYVVLGDFVSTEDGTGIVHIAPAFGQDDYEVARRYDLPILQPVTPGGRFTEAVTDWANRPVKTLTFQDRVEEGVDKEIVIALKGRGQVLKFANDYLHSYPHCWRCDNPLIYYARDSWYIRTTEYADAMIEKNREIRWQPPEIGSGRFGNWLEENKDWSLSRDRYWGTPLPIWVNEEDPADIFAIGSIEDLKQGEYLNEDGTLTPVAAIADRIDLHKPFVDNVIFRRDGKVYRRTSELIDVWFDSGAMPFAQWHYPFENRELFERHFPANFIAEGIDQTRGWFYTLHAIATPLFGRPATRNILVNDLVLDEKGQKMSKSRGNVVDPFMILNKYGADAARWYMITNSPPWKPTPFSETDLKNTVITGFVRLTNVYGFFSLYANIDGFTYAEPRIPVAGRAEIDRWILSVLNSLIDEYTALMDAYEPTRAMRLVGEFTDELLANWYVRRNRRRFWKGEMSRDKLAAYQTLYECLISVAKMMAPLAPFLSEYLFRALNGATGLEPVDSVHLSLMPQVEHLAIDRELERRMANAQKVVALARMLREKSKLKVRQPLRRILIAVSNDAEREEYRRVEEIIMDELNVKGVEYVGSDESSDVVRKKAKPNFKAIGPKFGKEAKGVAAAINAISAAQITELQRNGSLILTVGNDSFTIFPEDIEILHEDIEGWLVASEGAITVALDTELDQELVNEGIAREFVNRVQKLRKDSGLDVTDRIRLHFAADETLAATLASLRDYIMHETLAVELLPGSGDVMEEIDLGGQQCRIALERVDGTPAAH